MDSAIEIRPDEEPGRWIVEATHESRRWEIVLEPESAEHLLIVITAYPVESP